MSSGSTRILRVGPRPETDPAIDEAAGLLRAGQLVAFPTETVYGLGADATSTGAIEAVFAVKGRPADNPLIVHVASTGDLPAVCEGIDDDVLALARAFWPGPLTLVLRAAAALRATACRGLPTVAVRVPDHPVALALLRRARIPLAAPSANLSGRPSPTRAEDVLRDLDGRIPLVLDGGPCRIGLESTVLDPASREILRPGAITAEQIAAVMGGRVTVATGDDALRRSPGTRYRHYAPRAPLVLLGRAVSAEAARRLASALGRVGYLGTRAALAGAEGVIVSPLQAGDPAELARGLYAALRDLDAQGVDAILADAPERAGIGTALADRLERGARKIVTDDEDAERLAREGLGGAGA